MRRDALGLSIKSFPFNSKWEWLCVYVPAPFTKFNVFPWSPSLLIAYTSKSVNHPMLNICLSLSLYSPSYSLFSLLFSLLPLFILPPPYLFLSLSLLYFYSPSSLSSFSLLLSPPLHSPSSLFPSSQSLSFILSPTFSPLSPLLSLALSVSL